MNRFFCICIIGLFFISCKNPIKERDFNFKITSPQENWIFYTDFPILFSTNIRDSEINWYSSLDGFLGKGNGFSFILSEGNHIISAKSLDRKASVEITVLSNKLRNESILTYRINKLNQDLHVQKGNYKSLIYSFAGSAKKIGFSNTERKSSNYNQNTFQSNFIQKDFSLKQFVPLSKLKICEKTNKNRSVVAENQTRKKFYVINTKNQLEKPHILKAEIFYSGNSYTIWKPVDIKLNEELINQLKSNFENIIFPRTQKIFGTWADVDGDGKITILLCPSINQEKVAIGYFNPADLFTKNEDFSNESYNPYSNEMDIVYLAVPEISDAGSYGINSISATLAHEFTHAITFNQKTFKHLLKGNKNRSQEELFLDEGLSHLSENLCGFSVSGGNIAFLSHFFNDTASISFCKENIYGQNDSVGNRGAMVLFLSWLYRISPNGNAFLQKILSSENFGWNCIGEAYGTPTDSLFKTFIEDIAIAYKNNLSFISEIDSVTGEPLHIFCNMGEYNFGDNVYSIKFPKLYNATEKIDVLPYSFCLLNQFDFENIFSLKTECTSITDSVFIGLF